MIESNSNINKVPDGIHGARHEINEPRENKRNTVNPSRVDKFYKEMFWPHYGQTGSDNVLFVKERTDSDNLHDKFHKETDSKRPSKPVKSEDKESDVKIKVKDKFADEKEEPETKAGANQDAESSGTTNKSKFDEEISD